MLWQIKDSCSYNPKHINMNKSIHDKIAHQQLKNPITHSGKHHKGTEEHSDKNIGSGS